jgi:hypothetical protein
MTTLLIELEKRRKMMDELIIMQLDGWRRDVKSHFDMPGYIERLEKDRYDCDTQFIEMMKSFHAAQELKFEGKRDEIDKDYARYEEQRANVDTIIDLVKGETKGFMFITFVNMSLFGYLLDIVDIANGRVEGCNELLSQHKDECVRIRDTYEFCQEVTEFKFEIPKSPSGQSYPFYIGSPTISCHGVLLEPDGFQKKPDYKQIFSMKETDEDVRIELIRADPEHHDIKIVFVHIMIIKKKNDVPARAAEEGCAPQL